MARVMIFGSSGRSGQAMAEAARRRGHELLTPTHAECDLLHPQEVAAAVERAQAAVVINCAAISWLEACADDAAAAQLINTASPAAMARACQRCGATFVHLSTDYVLEGHTPGLKEENCACEPICAYGRSKEAAERAIRAACPSALILRVSWLCGNPARPGFPESMAAKALAGQPLAAIADKFSLPTDVVELAEGALQLAERRQGGTYHLCSTGEPISWWQSARMALQVLVEQGELPHLPELAEQRLAEAAFFREPRPQHTAMSNAQLRALGVQLSPAEETVRRAVLRWLASRRA